MTKLGKLLDELDILVTQREELISALSDIAITKDRDSSHLMWHYTSEDGSQHGTIIPTEAVEILIPVLKEMMEKTTNDISSKIAELHLLSQRGEL